MKKRDLKELEKEDLKSITGGKGETIENGNEEFVVDAFSLPIDPKFFEKKH